MEIKLAESAGFCFGVDRAVRIALESGGEKSYCTLGPIIHNSHVSDITWMLKKGSRLRIDISSSLHPLYHAHPNTEENWAVATERVTAKQTIYCGTEYPSKLVLPINRGY
jgi:4-hydroxy-3-methylbut-2-enyl diphosphate reductase IspH